LHLRLLCRTFTGQWRAEFVGGEDVQSLEAGEEEISRLVAPPSWRQFSLNRRVSRSKLQRRESYVKLPRSEWNSASGELPS